MPLRWSHLRLVRAPALLILVGATGCYSAQGPVEPQASPIPLPVSYASDTEPSASVAPDLSLGNRALASLIDEALRNNRDLRAASTRILSARARARSVGAAQFPEVGLGASADRSRQNFGLALPGGLGGGSETISRLSLTLDTAWELDLWGRLSSRTLAAVADFQATCADVRAARLSIAAQVAKVWLLLTEARLQTALAKQTVESFKRTHRVASARAEEGDSTKVDQHLADANLAGAEALLSRRRAEVATASRLLETLVGRVPRGALQGGVALPTAPGPLDPGAPAALIRRRPDLVAAERRLAATLSDLRAARADLYPRISLTGRAGAASADLVDLLSGDFLVWSLAAGLLQPVFDGGRLRAAVAMADGERKEAVQTFAARVLDALREVETALAVEATLRRRIMFVDRARRSLGAADSMATTRYEGGVEPYLTVLESQRRLLEAEVALISARRELLDTRIDLILALGGDATRVSGASITVAEAGGTYPESPLLSQDMLRLPKEHQRQATVEGSLKRVEDRANNHSQESHHR